MQPLTRKRKREQENFVNYPGSAGNSKTTSQIDSQLPTGLNPEQPIQFTTAGETFTIHFCNQQNSTDLSKKTLAWLETDFIQKLNPTNHFFHNKKRIAKAFKADHGLLICNSKDELVGFMTWLYNKVQVKLEIDIVEVNKDYQGKGIFKQMLPTLIQQYPRVHILTAKVMPQARAILKHLGWTANDNQAKQPLQNFYKLIKPSLESTNELADGHVIAICPTDYYEVAKNPEQYQNQMRYYQINLDEAQNLLNPILMKLSLSPRQKLPPWQPPADSYVAIYLDRKLITSARAKYIFDNEHFSYFDDILIIDQFKPKDPKLFIEAGFLENNKAETALTSRSNKRLRTDTTTLSANIYSIFSKLPANSDPEETRLDPENNNTANYSP